MATLDNIFGNHLTDLGRAMSRTTERHTLLTGNLANVNTPGYKRKDIDFNTVLQDEMTPSKERRQQLADQASQRASDQTSLRQDGNNVDMEHEVMSLAETELRYETLADMTSSYFGLIKSVIREGK